MWLEARQLTKAYGRRMALRHVSLTAERGEAIGIMGPNGAGKTTLLRMLLGLLRGGGSVLLDGVAVPGALAKVRVGYFAGESTLPPAVPVRRWRSLFHEVDATERRRIGELSRGSRQMVGLRTLFALPALDLIVLDEPWEGLDVDACRWLSLAIEARRSRGACVLVSSHRLHDLAGVCNRFLFLEDGYATQLDSADLAPDGTATAEFLLAAFDALRRPR